MSPPLYDENITKPSSSALAFFSALPSGPPINRERAHDELPSYSGRSHSKLDKRRERSERVEHVFHLRGSARPWLKLVVRSRAAKPEQMPYLLAGEPVTGYVELTLEKAEWFTSIEVLITGQTIADITAEKRDPWTFLNLRQAIWQASESAETKPSFMDRLRHRGGSGQKLEGIQRFDFSLEWPTTVAYKSGFAADEEHFALPASFTEQGAMCSVTYELSVQVKRGVLNTDVGFATDIAYCPVIRPARFSRLRKAAVEQGSTQVPGPDRDPDGWTSVETTSIRGEVFGNRKIDVSCTLSLGKPLSYTRGTFIPCALTLTSSDTQALDLLSAPSAPSLQLLAHLTYIPARRQTWRKPEHDRAKGKDSSTNMENPTKTRAIQMATWWPAPRDLGEQRPDKRVLFGEIHLNPRLKPALVVPDFKLFYTVALLPFNVPGFIPTSTPAVPVHTKLGSETNAALALAADSEKIMPLISHDVEIATLHAKGCSVVPQPTTPAKYDPPRRWPNTAMIYQGIIKNGY